MDIFRSTNDDLLRLAEDLAAEVRVKTGDLIESLAEIDRRRLYQDLHYTSLFDYCIYKLHMSEAAAYRRIRAARAIQIYPPVGPLLRTGKLTLESLALLHPFLNETDTGKLVEEASGKRVWEVERLVAGRRTEAPRRDVVRFTAPVPEVRSPESADETLFAPLAVETQAHPAIPMRASLPLPTQPAPPPPTSVRIAFTADEEFFKLLRHAQAVMRHK